MLDTHDHEDHDDNGMTMEKAAAAVQSIFNEHASDPRGQDKALELAAHMGFTIWMSHVTPEDVKGVSDLFTSPELREAFLSALSDVVNAPNNRESMIADNLRGWVGEELAALTPKP